MLCANLPVYPGRIASAGTDFWIAAPYVRNRVTEMLLDEPQLVSEMTTSINQDEWFVPRLRPVSPYTDTMQMGQLRAGSRQELGACTVGRDGVPYRRRRPRAGKAPTPAWTVRATESPA